MRFDDSLRTVLRSDSSSGMGAQATWRQLVDLAGRGRAATDETLIARLRLLRPAVPAEVRAASARALAHARPDTRLVAFFAEDDPTVASAVLRTADLPAADWIAMLPRLSPPLRAVLRHRRDVDAEVRRALDSFGPTDFALPEPEVGPACHAGDAAPPAPGFAISELVARIEAFRSGEPASRVTAPSVATPAAERFSFETDALGTVIGVEGVARGALVGLSIVHSGVQGMARLDAVAPGAFRHRARFRDARLEVEGASDAAGSWRLSGVPAFDGPTGRFLGFRGVARRPRADEQVGRAGPSPPSPDSLRQLVHELRTPATAIAGFAELIEGELLGPVADVHRTRAASIRVRIADLIAAIEDLDTASRIETRALELRPGAVALAPLLARVLDDLAPLAALRDVRVVVDGDDGARVFADDRGAERLIGRLLATLVSAGSAGEDLRVSVHRGRPSVELAIDRPLAFAGLGVDALLALDAEDVAEGAPLLGAGFALRVARNFAVELGGALEFGPSRLTLRLPAVVDRPVEHATIR